MATFGERLRYLREEKDLKQTELTKLLNLESSATISQYEKQNRIPDAHILQKMADLFDCSLDFLLGRTNNRKEKVDQTDAALEEFLKRSDIQFDGAPLDEEDKEDVKNFLRMVMKRKK